MRSRKKFKFVGKKQDYYLEARIKGESLMGAGELGGKRGRWFEEKVLYEWLMNVFDSRIIKDSVYQKDHINFRIDMGITEDLIIVPQYQSTYRLDFLLVNPRNKKEMCIEARFHSVPGSLEERLQAWFSKACESDIKSILTYAGGGWTSKNIDRAKKDIKKHKYDECVLGIFEYENEEKSKDMEKLIRKTLGLR